MVSQVDAHLYKVHQFFERFLHFESCSTANLFWCYPFWCNGIG